MSSADQRREYNRIWARVSRAQKKNTRDGEPNELQNHNDQEMYSDDSPGSGGGCTIEEQLHDDTNIVPETELEQMETSEDSCDVTITDIPGSSIAPVSITDTSPQSPSLTDLAAASPQPGSRIATVSITDRPGRSIAPVSITDRPGSSIAPVSITDRPGSSIAPVHRLKFSVVHFLEENEVDVAPSLWLAKSNGVLNCYWYWLANNASVLVRRCALPDKVLWKKYKVCVFSTTDSYSLARERARKGQDTSQVETVEINSRRINVPARYQEPDSDDEEEVIKKKKRTIKPGVLPRGPAFPSPPIITPVRVDDEGMAGVSAAGIQPHNSNSLLVGQTSLLAIIQS
ncbi:unnamed protein product [Arctogadus glacialis]